MYKNTKYKPIVIGLGYVGLPLVTQIAKKFKVTGFDINKKRVCELRNGLDSTKEKTRKYLNRIKKKISFEYNVKSLINKNFYIVTVPTPIYKNKKPDLRFIFKATVMLSKFIKKGDIIVYECTVYPGLTEKYCGKIISKNSGLKLNEDFYLGYSPERINPGDKKNTIDKITKVVSGSNLFALKRISNFYKRIIPAGIFEAKNIQTAEAAKVIENIQRDLNISLINELSLIFNKMGIDTQEVLDAAGTKWNFLKFLPGLVGGHCIGVDPYYLTHKAEAIGHHPEIILAGRRINDNMSRYVSSQLIKALVKRKFQIDTARVLVMGLTFKENCPDVRNTKSLDVVYELQEYGIKVDVMDPCCDELEVKSKFGIDLVNNPESATYDAVIITVRHQNFIDLGIEKIRSYGHDEVIIYDLKNTFEKTKVDMRL